MQVAKTGKQVDVETVSFALLNMIMFDIFMVFNNAKQFSQSYLCRKNILSTKPFIFFIARRIVNLSLLLEFSEEK